MMRLMHSHNTLVAEFSNFKGLQLQITNATMLTLETLIPGFQDEYERSLILVRVEDTIKARLIAQAQADLAMFAQFGETLAHLKAEAKKLKIQSRFNKVMRRVMREMQEANPEADIHDAADIPDLKVVKPDSEEVIDNG